MARGFSQVEGIGYAYIFIWYVNISARRPRWSACSIRLLTTTIHRARESNHEIPSFFFCKAAMVAIVLFADYHR